MPKYEMNERVEAQIDNAFTYHSPQEDQPKRYTMLRDRAKALAVMIAENTPPSSEQSIALTKLEEAVMFANAAIARNEGALPEVTVSINGENFQVPASKLSHEEVCKMAEQPLHSTVVYSNAVGGIDGSLIPGVSVRICEGTRFTAVVTG